MTKENPGDEARQMSELPYHRHVIHVCDKRAG